MPNRVVPAKSTIAPAFGLLTLFMIAIGSRTSWVKPTKMPSSSAEMGASELTSEALLGRVSHIFSVSILVELQNLIGWTGVVQ